MNETLIFFKIVPYIFNTLIPVSFQSVEALQMFSYDMVWSCAVVFLLIFSTSSDPQKWIFRNKKKLYEAR